MAANDEREGRSLHRTAALAETAALWRDPEHPPRREAVRRTLGAANGFTEEALAFALNHAAQQCTEKRLAAWAQPASQRHATEPLTVGVLGGAPDDEGNTPFGGFRDLLAVLLAGHRYVGSVAEASPHLLPAFLKDLGERFSNLPAQIVDADEVVERADALVAPARDGIADRCAAAGIPPARRWLRRARWSVAVLDGSESEDEREGLAEDAWLHDGRGRASVRLVWAPRGLSPDPYLDAMANFRSIFPAHDDLPGALAMQCAMLEARDEPHAYADGLVFLMSKGDPKVQLPGHLRWAEYDDPADVERWLRAQEAVHQVAARDQLAERLAVDLPTTALGNAHRSALGERPGEADLMRFLSALGRG